MSKQHRTHRDAPYARRTMVRSPTPDLHHSCHQVLSPSLNLDSIILHEDDQLLAVAKPAGVPCVPGPGFQNNLTAMLEATFQRKLFPSHRLDRLTSGVFLLAKQKTAAASLSKAIAERRCRKVYLAKVAGRFPGSLQEMPLNLEARLGVASYPAGTQEAKEAGEVAGDSGFDSGGWLLISKPLRYDRERRRALIGWMSSCEAQRRNRLNATGYHMAWDGRGPRDADELAGEAESEEGGGLEAGPSMPEGAQDARTACRRVWYCPKDDSSLVECVLHTGRTHQVAFSVTAPP